MSWDGPNLQFFNGRYKESSCFSCTILRMSGQGSSAAGSPVDPVRAAAKVGALSGKSSLSPSFRARTKFWPTTLSAYMEYFRRRGIDLWRSSRRYSITQPHDTLALMRYPLVCMRFNLLVYVPTQDIIVTCLTSKMRGI